MKLFRVVRLIIVFVFCFVLVLFGVEKRAVIACKPCKESTECSTCCVREPCPSYTCAGVDYNAVGDIIEGFCEVAYSGDCPAGEWGEWSACVNYCMTRECSSLPIYQIVSCDGGTCGTIGTGDPITVCNKSDKQVVTPFTCPADAVVNGRSFMTVSMWVGYV